MLPSIARRVRASARRSAARGYVASVDFAVWSRLRAYIACGYVVLAAAASSAVARVLVAHVEFGFRVWKECC